MWDVRHKKNPCPACCPEGRGNAWFDLIAKDLDAMPGSANFNWRCRNCGHEVEAYGISHDDQNIGLVWTKQLDEDGFVT